MSGNKIRVPDHQRRKASLFGHSQINGFQRNKFQDLPVGPIESIEDDEESFATEGLTPQAPRPSKITLQGLNLDELRLRKSSGVHRGDLEDMIKPRYRTKNVKARAQPPPKQAAEVDIDRVYADHQITKILVDEAPMVGAPRPYATKILSRKEPKNEQEMEEEIYSALVEPGNLDKKKSILDHRQQNLQKNDQSDDLRGLAQPLRGKKVSDPSVVFVPSDPTKEAQVEHRGTAARLVPLSLQGNRIYPRSIPGNTLDRKEDPRSTNLGFIGGDGQRKLENANRAQDQTGFHQTLDLAPSKKIDLRDPLSHPSHAPFEDETWQSKFEDVRVTNLFRDWKDPKERFADSIVDEEWIDRSDSFSFQTTALGNRLQRERDFGRTEEGDEFSQQPKPNQSHIRTKGDPKENSYADQRDGAFEEGEIKDLRGHQRTTTGQRDLSRTNAAMGDPLEFLDSRLEKISIQTQIKNRDPSLAMAPPDRNGPKDRSLKMDALPPKRLGPISDVRDRYSKNPFDVRQDGERRDDRGGLVFQVSDKERNHERFVERDLRSDQPLLGIDPSSRRTDVSDKQRNHERVSEFDIDGDNSTITRPKNDATNLVDPRARMISNRMVGPNADPSRRDTDLASFDRSSLFQRATRTLSERDQVTDNGNLEGGQTADKKGVVPSKSQNKNAISVAEDQEDVRSWVPFPKKIDSNSSHRNSVIKGISMEGDADSRANGMLIKKPFPPKVSITVKGDNDPQSLFDKQQAAEDGSFFPRPFDVSKRIQTKPSLEPPSEFAQDILSTRLKTKKKNLPKPQKRSVKESDFVLVFETDTETEKFTPNNSTKKETKRERRSMTYQTFH